MYPSETTRSFLVGKGSLGMRLTVSEGNMTLKKPSTHRGTMPDSPDSPRELSALGGSIGGSTSFKCAEKALNVRDRAAICC